MTTFSRKRDQADWHKRRHVPKRRAHSHHLEKTPKQHIGVFLSKGLGGFLSPCHRKDSFSGTYIDAEQSRDIKDNDVILYSISHEGKFQLIKNLGSINSPKSYTKIGIHAYNLPYAFSDESQRIANKGSIPSSEHRADLRNIPLVTIDGPDAKDFDDAVFAIKDEDPKNKGGWRAIVAIADVSYYVPSGSALDKEAYLRGNSVYFVDKVVPMLPEQLSNNLCSLRPNEDRACLAVEMIITSSGKLKSYHFKRARMRSRARLTYEQVEKALHGETDSTTKELLDEVIQPLYGCYKSLKKARDCRGTIQVERIENTFILNNDGYVEQVKPRNRLESHQIIEELMIAANVAAAKALQAKNWPTIYRVHERPDKIRLQNIYTLAKGLKLKVEKFTNKNVIHSLNKLLLTAKNLPFIRLFNELILRSQAQAQYSPINVGHFGLNLTAYCHFTSPIRRYADLVVHRSLVAALELDSEKKHYAVDLDLDEISDHISKTERIAMNAEREVEDRFMASYMQKYLGSILEGVIVGVSISGIFVEISNIGAQGFIPKQDLGNDYFVLNETQHCYVGRRTRKMYQIGNSVRVLVTNADPILCSIGFALVKDKKTPKLSKKSIAKKHTQRQEKPRTKKKLSTLKEKYKN